MNLKERIIKKLPLLLIIAIVLILFFKNYVPGSFFSGWDNSHAEFNLWEFTERVFSGAWVEFQGTGAPAAQSQLAEIPRLPYIFLLNILFPNNLIRYIFTFLMVAIGGIGAYLYLKKVWLNKTNSNLREWIACFGGLFYILNIISLQQFFINFELYAVEFAFFPITLWSIHIISDRFSSKNILLFVIIQLSFTPTAYVPTVFYIAFFFWLIYAFFLNLELQKGWLMAFKKTVIITSLIFFINSFWMLPNLYYVFHNSRYVKESISNQLFNMEALASVKEAGNLENFFTGIHYLFTWKDFNFATRQHEPIFLRWMNHLSNNFVLLLLIIFNIFAIAGFFYILINPKKGKKRWGLIIIYLFTTSFIWMGLIIPEILNKIIYQSGVILEAFRNPFTKLSNYYSFLLSIMICSSLEEIIQKATSSKIRSGFFLRTFPILLLSFSFGSLFCISLPSFQGNFINDKLKIRYPSEYFEMFSYLKTKSKNLRVLELPFLSHAGWLYYYWPWLGKENGYQGMGFYIFGIPQPLLTPDHARWTQTTDFFYHELKYALNSQNTNQLKKILEKYRVNLIIVDETSIWKNTPNYNKIHRLLTALKYQVVWKKNFLTIYEVSNDTKNDKLIVPKKISFVSANVNRARYDYIYENIGGYVNVPSEKADIIFPFANFSSLQLNDVLFKDSRIIAVERNLLQDDYQIKIPGVKNNRLSTPAEISYINQTIKIIFPETKIIFNDNEINLYQLSNLYFKTDKKYQSLRLFFNEKMVEINDGQTIYPTIFLDLSEPIEFSYTGVNDKAVNQNILDFKLIKINQPEWQLWQQDIITGKKNFSKIIVTTKFPHLTADLKRFPSENCGEFGKINTFYQDNKAFYLADDYGVNCNHYDFENVEFNYPYLLHLSGINYQGRSLKFFINYGDNTLPEEYLMREGKYSTTLVLLPINYQFAKSYAFNWESRSYAKESKNALLEMKIAPFPVDKISQIELIRRNPSFIKNNIQVKDRQFFLTYLYFIKLRCNNNHCYFGIDQSYDDLWIAIDNNLSILPHFKYNNWANLWQINQSSNNIVIFYIPGIVSLFCLSSLIPFIGFSTISFIKHKALKNA